MSYTAPAKYLHWVIAGLIVVQYVLGELAEGAAEQGGQLAQLALLANHKSVGMTVLMLALIRLAWRATHTPPPLQGARMQVLTARAAHWAMYGLIFALPVSGWLMSSASAYSVSWFNLFTFPDLVGADAEFKETLEFVHEALARALFLLAVVHVAAAAWHHFYAKDAVLRAMWSLGAVVLAVLLAAGAIRLLGSVDSPAGDTMPAAQSVAASEPAAADTQSSLPLWVIDYSNSEIRFSAEQAGAGFSGVFAQWQGQIQFDEANLVASRARVAIDLRSVNTADAERDQTLAQPEWFAAPQAVFAASEFSPAGEEYEATNATLDFGSGPLPIAFRFSIASHSDRLTLNGTAQLDRLALNIGTGDWTDTTWVGQYVDVEVRVSVSGE